MTATLAAINAEGARQIIIACALLIGALVVLIAGVWYYRRHYLSSAESAEPLWTFDDLRKMRQKGDLSEAEYQKLRAALIGLYGAGIAEQKPVADGRPETDAGGGEGDDFDLEESPPR